MKKYFFLLMVLLTVSATAATPKKKVSKKNSNVAKVDTIDIRKFSYLMGRINTQGLKPYLAQQKGVDTTYMAQFIDGFNQAEMTIADKQAKARIAGMEIYEDVMKRVLPSLSKQVDESGCIMDRDLFIRGFLEGLMETPSEISNDSAVTLIQKNMEYYTATAMEKKYGQNRIDGENFLKANLKKDSVQHTASGLQYKVITMGTGDKPTKDQKVKVNYEGRLINGTVFDSSYKRKQPATFGVGQVIKGWTEALQLMPVGSKWELYIPQELAYGAKEQGKIPPFSCLIFTVELLDIVK